MDPDSKRLRVTVSDGRGRSVTASGLAEWLVRVAPPRARGEVAVALVSDARIRALNHQYRGRDGATDVLSFRARPERTPATPPAGHADADQPFAQDPIFIGDIVVATGLARRQAREAGHAYATELRVLALHGLLHLLGYDHHDPADRGRMARLERRLRTAGGLPAGLIERSAGGVHA